MNENFSFEQALKRLEEIVETLEAGNISLEESIKIYQEGIALSKLCSGKLEEAEGKVMAIMNRGSEQMEEFSISQIKEA
ncbi:MAG TPA: exodeoxyribonuclease VII small subunit [Bacillota bacterium]|nr:exodeoxyribonuclease VII small subunit [Clostridia bacterium]MDD3439129.1 exodeoxyribonuclease VII small subunit [Clostridiaceae bacterium]HNR03464.1 exodeoxyribonuclease VII small subunit [Bacillota bacterium]HRU42865.1 exodeoxyribonuclease VII small subunit [Candidatus Diapherotrites archaeon]HNT02676.1 exodeoxyribonuclease VII small subunit [Bacillota bacterium]